MLASWMSQLVVAAGLLFVVPCFSCAVERVEKNAQSLKRELEERERQLNRAQREVAEARARLALAEGMRASAIAELRKAVTCCQNEVQWIRDHANWYCDPRDPMDEARWDLAKTRVWLAEVEGDAVTQIEEWKHIVAFHEQRRERARRLEQMRAVEPAEVKLAQEELDKARCRLESAEKQLSDEQAKKLEKSK